MPRTRRAPQPNSIIASAARINAGARRNLPNGSATGQAWQSELWQMLDDVGELEFYRRWISNALSRCTLGVKVDTGERDGDGEPIYEATDDPRAVAALEALFGGEAGQSQMLGTMGGHLAIPGETWLFGLVDQPSDPDIDQWRVLSHEEIQERGDSWVVDRGDGRQEGPYSPEQALAIRIWSPHPRKAVWAHSSAKAALPVLRELVGHQLNIGAAIDSRLAGAGVLCVPSEMTFAPPPGLATTGAADADAFIATLAEAMMTAKQDRGDPSAVVPIMIKAPGDLIGKIKHLTFSTDFDAKQPEHVDRALRRLANILDVPAEVLLGLADVNHWTGWMIDEAAIKIHVEPILNVITSGLTGRYMWPAMQGTAQTFDPALRRFRIVGSTAELRQRPNHSTEAMALHSSLTLTDLALARETGFEASDLLSPRSPEFRDRVLVQLLRSPQPEVVAAALNELGVSIETLAPAAPSAPAAPLPAAPAPTPLPPQDRRTLPQAAALTSVSELMLARALERAWNRAGKRGKTRGPVDPSQLNTCLADAWGYVPRAASTLGVDPAALTTALDGYARHLLVSGTMPDPDGLQSVLAAVAGS